MRIGELARAAGVHVQTIRFYERRRLIAAPSRSAAGYRDYTTDTVQLVRFIKRLQARGYALKEIRELLALSERGTQVGQIVRERAAQKLQHIEAEIARLCGIRDEIRQFVGQCDAGVVPHDCLVLRRATTRAGLAPRASSSSSAVASRNRSLSDPATDTQCQSRRLSRIRPHDRPPRLRRDRV
jgi:MerR family transcriptional regulator, copper efflux regulator